MKHFKEPTSIQILRRFGWHKTDDFVNKIQQSREKQLHSNENIDSQKMSVLFHCDTKYRHSGILVGCTDN